MSTTNISDSFGLTDEMKEIYFLLLKKSPLTLGELIFLTKKSEDKIKSSLTALIESEFVYKIDEAIPLYLGLYPTPLISTNLEKFLVEINEFNEKFNSNKKSDIDGLLKKGLGLNNEIQKNSNLLIKNYNTTHTTGIQELENQKSLIINNSIQSQSDILKEISNDFSEQRSTASINLTAFSTSILGFIEEFNKKIDSISEQLQSSANQNRKQIRKSISDTIKSLDEGAKLLGKNVNDQLKNFEGKLVDSINSSISATVELSNSFKLQLIEDYSTWRAENSEFVNNLEAQNNTFITDSINTNVSSLNSFSSVIISKFQLFLDNFNKALVEISKKSTKFSEERTTSFISGLEIRTNDFTNFFTSLKGEIDSNWKNYNSYIDDYKKTLTQELKSFLNFSFLQFEENFKNLTQILTEFISIARISFDKEYGQILSDNNDVLDKIVEILSNLKNNYEKELSNLETTVENLEDSFKDLSVAIKRRFDKFSTEASSHIQSMGNKIIDELLHIQGSNIDLIEQQNALKANFALIFEGFTEHKNDIISKTQNEFSNLNKSLLDQKKDQLDIIEKEVKEYNVFIIERHSILENQLKVKNNDFINEFKISLAKIRENAQKVIETEQTDYIQNLTEISTSSSKLLVKEKESVINSLDSISETLNKNIQEALDSINQAFNKLRTSINGSLNLHKSNFAQTFDQVNSNVDKISLDYISNYKGVLESSVNSLKNVEITYWSKFEDAFIKNEEKILEIYKTNTDTLQLKTNGIIKSLSGFLDDISNSFSNLNSEINSNLTNLSNTISTKLSEVQDSANIHFQSFEGISNDLEQISQKSKLEIEKELLDVENELKTVTEKNFVSYSQLMTSSTAQFNKVLENVSEISVTQINAFEKELLDNVQNIKQENETNREEHLNNLVNLSKDSVNDLNVRNSKQIAVTKDARLQLEEKSQILIENLIKKINETQILYQKNINSQFDEIENLVPTRLKEYIGDVQLSVNELFETLNQNIFKEIKENITSIESSFKSSQVENQKGLQQNLNQLKMKFSEHIEEIKGEFLETSKLRIEEIEVQINKELEVFQNKLVKKEDGDVKRIRDLIQSINSVGIFNELVNENLVSNIDPLKDAIENSVSNFSTNFEKLKETSGITNLTDLQQKTIQEFNDLLINSFNASIGKLNNIQKVFSDQMNNFGLNVENFLNKTLESSKENQLNLFKDNQEKFIALHDNQLNTINAFVGEAVTSMQNHNDSLRDLISNYHSFFTSIHTVLLKSNKDVDNLYKSRLINAPDDVYRYLEQIITKTDKRLDLIISKPEFLDLKSIIDLHTRVRIKIVVNSGGKSDKSDKRSLWINELYKKKANVQIYDSSTISNLIICIRDNTEVLVISEKSKSTEFTPGFLIENNLFADYFSKAIVNNIISFASPITREPPK